MSWLGLETSSSVGSVALETAAGVRVREIPTPREQTERLLSLIDELLAEAGVSLHELDGIAVGRGPGSFTGLRVSMAVAQGLSAVSGVPLLPVSSLLGLAERARREYGCEEALVCVDAHMGEVYWALARRGVDGMETVGDERLGAPSTVVAPQGSAWFGVGSGFAAHAEALAPLLPPGRALPHLVPSAVDLLPRAKRDLAAGLATAPSAALPVYLREQTAWRRSS